MTLHAHAMVALVAKRDAERLYYPDDGVSPSPDDWLEAERLYDVAFEAEERTTPEALAEVEAWIEGRILLRKGRAA